ncbi:hypothetical protein [Pseudolactococcus carnosus]|uniref:Uncharacterized protein n=1 Tax=Pseudolactococcus carnosus TaxID=2749961 RepID=A0ABT0ATI9_9LACT|nr:hypothetical protein [Lactococcus carnosus]MCJ1990030.1 hypothetical protein [Lactococcus carnosus]
MKRRGGCLTIFLLFVFVIVALNIENYFFSHIEGAIAGAAAGIGFAFGSLNLIWGALDTKSKDWVYRKVEDAGDWLVDKVADTGKSIGKASKGTWQSVTSFFGGGQQAYD